jgi:hypothetical protein
MEQFATSRSPDSDYCATLFKSKPELFLEQGAIRLSPAIQIGESGVLKDAIVAIQNLNDTSFQKNFGGTEVVIERCEFQPYVGVVVDKTNFRVINLDQAEHTMQQSISHNPHGYESAGSTYRTLFNIGLVTKGSQLNKSLAFHTVTEKSALKLLCDQHPYMQSWFLPVTNPYYAVTKADGRFEIRDVPAGRHVVKAWHPKAGAIGLDIMVPDKGVVQADFVIPAK